MVTELLSSTKRMVFHASAYILIENNFSIQCFSNVIQNFKSHFEINVLIGILVVPGIR